MGVGGDDSWGEMHEEFKLYAGRDYTYSFSFKGYALCKSIGFENRK